MGVGSSSGTLAKLGRLICGEGQAHLKKPVMGGRQDQRVANVLAKRANHSPRSFYEAKFYQDGKREHSPLTV